MSEDIPLVNGKRGSNKDSLCTCLNMNETTSLTTTSLSSSKTISSSNENLKNANNTKQVLNDSVVISANRSGGGDLDETNISLSPSAIKKPKNTRCTCCNCCCHFVKQLMAMCFNSCCNCLGKSKGFEARTIHIGKSRELNYKQKFPKNVVRNQKYSIFTFIPIVLFQQFAVFLNLYFLVMALSQFIPSIRIGLLYTYWAPLAFVITVTMLREAYDDFKRYLRDKELNSQLYKILTYDGIKMVPSSQLKVSDVIIIEKNQRVPADIVLLKTSEKSGTCFIRTDQLDGETDWKLRVAVSTTQNSDKLSDLLDIGAQIYAEKPQLRINAFEGIFIRNDAEKTQEPLSIENTLWSNTVLASGTAYGAIIYTGRETRSVMNTSKPSNKIGLLDKEINNLTKLLFTAVVLLSLVMVALKGFHGPWYRYLFRFILLFSYIIPISLRVNIDMAKTVYSWFIQHDKEIPSTLVRSSTMSEELGRISYMLSDKTGTLTQNEMVFKRLHLGTVSFGSDSMDEITHHLRISFRQEVSNSKQNHPSSIMRRTIVTRIRDAIEALALCHNVTPVYEANMADVLNKPLDQMGDEVKDLRVTYQASSPDEIALVSWTENIGLTLIKRDLNNMILRGPQNELLEYDILQVFPFTSETKRMGIIIRDKQTDEIVFFLKGADTVMQSIVQYNDWLNEECSNMAREGLRTLVVAKKILTLEQYSDFEQRLTKAKLSIQDRNQKIQNVIESLEKDLELLCLTGVEDKLQQNVRTTLETLRNAGVKIWMLTGDKLETATCIAKSSKLVSRDQDIYTFKPIESRDDARNEMNNFRRKVDTALVILGESLELVLKFYEQEFIEIVLNCPAVVVCRCSPTQKAQVVHLLKKYAKGRILAIGDGGNDVSMIQAAHVGVGIQGKEGVQASLAADFSITQFSHVARLILVHGRNSYKRSASLSQFVMHRGLIISIIQAIFSSVYYYASISLYQGFLLVGYATVYTMFPVFSLVLDKDVSPQIALTYPELYKELTKGRSLSYKTFLLWVLISIYQGAAIIYGSLLLFEQDFNHIVAITFTALILTELLMVGLTVRSWHFLMIVAMMLSLVCYIFSLLVFKDFFDAEFIQSLEFAWKVTVITLVSCLPLYILKCIRIKFSPPNYAKLMQSHGK
ncbi:unnamed protein product [Brachionus calyciflorus]|uniref:Phospholipid-transporting ATPase n=1 Tax=Brachionus calyciflorus TaxID=104777 RepID=A0A813Y9Y0_9BILA|nr:unnamed protein product [Brachionus calyciflorus]